MAHVMLLFPRDYISAADLHGKDVHLTISRVIVDELRTERGTERKPVVMFRETDAKRDRGGTGPFKLVLNRTNAKAVVKALGTSETEEWVGRRVTLFATTCMAFGQTVDCVRIRERAAPPPKKGGKPEPEPPPQDEPEPGEMDEPDFDPDTGEVKNEAAE